MNAGSTFLLSKSADGPCSSPWSYAKIMLFPFLMKVSMRSFFPVKMLHAIALSGSGAI